VAHIGIRLPRGEWFFDDSRRLGRPGGFGEVFEGEDVKGNPVAVKRLKVTAAEAAHRELTISDELAGRSFEHVLAPLDAGQDADTDHYFVVMPRADGSLADAVEARGPLPPDEAVDVIRQIAAGLQEIPEIVHRDLKPANVLFLEGHWRIADFGIARFLEDATSLNTLKECLTPAFAAPEQWNSEHATSATDVYALSCIAHVLFNGTPPFPGPTPADYREQHLSAAPPLLTPAPPPLRALVAAGLRKLQSTRPSIGRVSAVLEETASNPAQPSPAIEEFRAANAAEAERRSQVEADGERQRRKHAEREALIEAGNTILQKIVLHLADVARENASEADIRQVGSLSIGMGTEAILKVELQGAVPPNAVFPNSKWDVLAIGRIDVKQLAQHEWNHGATLWYMRFGRGEGYRWYEVSYKRGALFTGSLIGPFAIQYLGDDIYGHADAAAGSGLHSIEVEFGPTPIDDEAVNAFVERWLARLAAAYEGRLRPF